MPTAPPAACYAPQNTSEKANTHHPYLRRVCVAIPRRHCRKLQSPLPRQSTIRPQRRHNHRPPKKKRNQTESTTLPPQNRNKKVTPVGVVLDNRHPALAPKTRAKKNKKKQPPPRQKQLPAAPKITRNNPGAFSACHQPRVVDTRPNQQSFVNTIIYLSTERYISLSLPDVHS